jgi:hypothetical protein
MKSVSVQRRNALRAGGLHNLYEFLVHLFFFISLQHSARILLTARRIFLLKQMPESDLNNTLI